MRGICARHLKDLKEGPKRGLKWDLDAANRAIGFFRDKLCVDNLNSSDADTKPFELIDWQKFIVGSLFGWKDKDGTRRFRMAFIESGKGSGKSPLAAGVGLYMMAADGEYRAEIYAAAQKKDQAKVLFRDAVAMVENSPGLSSRLHMSGGVEKNNIAYLKKGSFFRPISTEDRGRGQSGPRPHCGLLDEVHEHSTNSMVEFMRAGTKGRRQALIFMITNSGSDRLSVCWDYHEYGAKVCAGIIEDDSFFPYICALDDDDDPLNDESCWAKANPSIGITFKPKYLQEQVRMARGMPSKQNLVLRLNFCKWTDAQDAWLGREAWVQCEDEDIQLSDYEGRDCFAAIDLSARRDLTALSLVFPEEGGSLTAFTEFWTPKDTLEEREDKDRVPYRKWAEDGYLTTTPGKTIDYAWVAMRLAEIDASFNIIALGYDRWRILDLLREMEGQGIQAYADQGVDAYAEDEDGVGIRLISIGQGWRDMGPAVEAIEEVILNGRLRVQFNPVLRWNVSSVVTEEDPAGNRKFTKRKATGRIDGAVSLAMAVRLATRTEIKGEIETNYRPGQLFL